MQTPAFSVWTLAPRRRADALARLFGWTQGLTAGRGTWGQSAPSSCSSTPCLPSGRGGCFRTSSSGRGRRRHPRPPRSSSNLRRLRRPSRRRSRSNLRPPAAPPLAADARARRAHLRRGCSLRNVARRQGLRPGWGNAWRRSRSAEHPVPERKPAGDRAVEDVGTNDRAVEELYSRSASTPPSVRHNARGWSSNVLGVEARVDNSGVTLSWQRPARSRPSRRRPAARSAGPRRRGLPGASGELPRLGGPAVHRLSLHDRQLRPPRPPFHRGPDDRADRRLYLGLAAHGEPGHGVAQHAHRREDRHREHHATAPDREPREDPGEQKLFGGGMLCS